jgi:metal-responsive CopG/Arc/MetJ family transcriptional regulator
MIVYSNMKSMIENHIKQIADNSKSWRVEDLRYIYKHHRDVSVKNMADHLGISYYMVKNMMAEMDITPISGSKGYMNVTIDNDLIEIISQRANEKKISRSEFIESIIKRTLCQSGTTLSDSASLSTEGNKSW